MHAVGDFAGRRHVAEHVQVHAVLDDRLSGRMCAVGGRLHRAYPPRLPAEVPDDPARAVVANFAWEILWGFFFKPDMGLVVWWGYRTWAILDIGIVYLLFKYGRKQLITQNGQAYFVPTVIFGLIAWFASLYFFVHDGYDISIGANGAYIMNMMMSALVCRTFIAKHPDIRSFSFPDFMDRVSLHSVTSV